MAFNPEPVQTPTHIGAVEIHLYHYLNPDTLDEIEGTSYEVSILDQDGNTMVVKHGDLAPHLSPAQIAALRDFMDSMRVLAQGFLPTP